MNENEEFDEDVDGIDFFAPLDTRFVVLGLAMMIFGLPISAFTENVWAKYFGLFCFLASFFVMTKKDSRNNSR